MDAEERTAHEVRRLKASVQDLQNALRLASGMEAAARPPKNTLPPQSELTASAYSHILANNDRGVLHGIERLQEIGVAVVGLNGVGALAAEAFARYGVASLLLVDNFVITAADLSYMQFQAQDVGSRKDERLARILSSVNPDVDVRAAGVALGKTQDVVRALRAAAANKRSGCGHRSGRGRPSDGSDEDDVVSNSNSSSEMDGSDEADSDSDGGGGGLDEVETQNQRRAESAPAAKITPSRSLHVVFLCVQSAELASALNELCCEFGALFVFVFVGTNGISGEVLAVSPGRSSCLQCLERRKVIKTTSVKDSTSSTSSPSSSSSEHPDALDNRHHRHEAAPHPPQHHTERQQQQQQLQYRLRPCLPSTECILSGLGVQNALVQLLGFGTFCSRVEYDGLRDEMDRSGLLPPVHQCASALCRLQQRQQQQ